jgi:hypothetical protein
MKDIKEINKILQDHERRLSVLENKKKVVDKKEAWYKPGSTVDKLVKLISEGFFNKPKSIKEIISKLKERDFHLEASDLTLPLRKVVRKNLLEKTKQLGNGGVSKKWLYRKI